MNLLSSNNKDKKPKVNKFKLPKLDMKWTIIIVAVAILAYFSVVPMIYLIIRGIFFEGNIDFESYITVYSSIINWNALSNTFLLAAEFLLELNIAIGLGIIITPSLG